MSRSDHGGHRDEIQVVRDGYALARELAERVQRFPRSHRYGLGAALETRARRILELLIRAKYDDRRIERLEEANLELEVLRFELRLAADLGIMPHRGREAAIRTITAVGRQVGGWLAHVRSRRPRAIADRDRAVGPVA